jgi:hypothetical protein
MFAVWVSVLSSSFGQTATILAENLFRFEHSLIAIQHESE